MRALIVGVAGDDDIVGIQAFRDDAEQIDHRLIGFPSLRSKAREAGAEVRAAVEGHVFIDLAPEKAFAQRAVGDKTDSELLKKPVSLPFQDPSSTANIRSGRQ